MLYTLLLILCIIYLIKAINFLDNLQDNNPAWFKGESTSFFDEEEKVAVAVAVAAEEKKDNNTIKIEIEVKQAKEL